MKRLLRYSLRALTVTASMIGVALVVVLAYPYVHPVSYVNEDEALVNRLAIPPLLDPQIENGEKVFALNVVEGETEFLPGHPAHTAGYNGSILGPTIRAHQGDTVRMRITNQLGELTTVHWHGMHLPAAMDGGPHQPIVPGTTWSPHWTIHNQAATLWYHPHTMGMTAAQVYSGLAGLFIIDDDRSDSLPLPKTYGVDDIPLVVQDRNFDSRGRLDYRRGRGQQLFGELGDKILVNGTYAPYVDIPKSLVRFRILNGSNARRYNFVFSDGRAFYQIATDGGFLDGPVKRTNMVLAPGERAEIIVDMRSGDQRVTLMSDAVPGRLKVADFSRQVFMGGNDEYQRFKILELRPVGGAPAVSELPAQLGRVVYLDETKATRTRFFRLTSRMSINGKSMDHRRIDEVVVKGDTEIWEIRNEEAMFYHPFHIHDVQFQILSRDGKPPADYERAWKDTVLVNPLETVRVIARFTEYSNPNVPYVYHCHILDHEDMGMMGQFVVVDDPSAKIGVASPLTELENAEVHPQGAHEMSHP